MTQLKRHLGLWQCTLIGIGVMLGAGIYALVGEAAGMAGNAVWISFLLASLVAMFTALSYAELSSFISKAGGQYYFVARALGQIVGFLVSWLMQVGIAVGAAAVALAFGSYLSAFVTIDEVLAASLLIVVSAAILVYGVRETAWVAGVCTAVELIGLLIIVLVGLPNLGAVDYLATGPGGAAGVLAAGTLVFFAYIGFEQIVQLSDETRDATRTIPITILLSITITAALYILVAICAVSVLGWERLGASDAPLAEVAAAALGPRAFLIIALIALFSTGNTVLIFLMSGARLLFGMAEDGAMPRVLARVHSERKTPYVSCLVISAAALGIVVAMRDLTMVANLTNLALLVAFVVVNASVIVLRYREPDVSRPFRVPLNVGKFPILPLLGMLTSLGMVLFVGWLTIVFGLALILVGLAAWWFKQRSTRADGHRSS